MRLSRENGLFFNIFLGHESGQLPGAPQLYSSVHETILNGLYMYMQSGLRNLQLQSLQLHLWEKREKKEEIST